MTSLLILAALYGAWRAGRALLVPLQALPRCNEDMVLF